MREALAHLAGFHGLAQLEPAAGAGQGQGPFLLLLVASVISLQYRHSAASTRRKGSIRFPDRCIRAKAGQLLRIEQQTPAQRTGAERCVHHMFAAKGRAHFGRR